MNQKRRLQNKNYPNESTFFLVSTNYNNNSETGVTVAKQKSEWIHFFFSSQYHLYSETYKTRILMGKKRLFFLPSTTYIVKLLQNKYPNEKKQKLFSSTTYIVKLLQNKYPNEKKQTLFSSTTYIVKLLQNKNPNGKKQTLLFPVPLI